jgi:hypothetical protein
MTFAVGLTCFKEDTGASMRTLIRSRLDQARAMQEEKEEEKEEEEEEQGVRT